MSSIKTRPAVAVMAGPSTMPCLPVPDRDILAEYLATLGEQSSLSARNMRKAIMLFYDSIGVKSITALTIDDINAFVEQLKVMVSKRDGKPWKNSMKNQQFLMAKAWMHRALKALAARKIIISNLFDYVDNPFSASHAKKKADSMKIDIDLDAKANIKALTDGEIEKIMKATAFEERWFQVLFLILKHTGMRISEAITIRLENIDLQERVLASGVVKDYRKTGKVVFFVSREIAIEIKAYTILLDDGEEWLFPAKFSPGTHITRDTINRKIQRFAKKTVHFTAHQFRHTIIKKREQMDCPSHINEFLQNQVVTGTQAAFYRERNFTIRDRRDLHDKWNPYQ